MAALVQTYPQQSSTVTMLQTRPASASGILQPISQNQSHQFPPNHAHRNSFHGMNGMQLSNYRGQSAMTPIAPYAFASAPSLSIGGQRTANGSHMQSNQRTFTAPIIPTLNQHDSGRAPRGSRYPAPLSTSTTSSSSSDLSGLSHRSGSKDDSAIASTARIATRAPRPQSTFITSTSSPNLAPPSLSSKASPDRYRRPGNRRTDSNNQQSSSQVSTASIPNVVQFYGKAVQQSQTPAKSQGLDLQIPQFSGSSTSKSSSPASAVDDTQMRRLSPQDQAAKRYRRRSIHTIDAGDYAHLGPGNVAGSSQPGPRQISSSDGRISHQQHQIDQQQHPLRSSPVVTVRPATSHERNGSNDSVNSARSSHHSRPNSAKREASTLKPTGSPSQQISLSIGNTTTAEQTSVKDDPLKLINIPPRASSDASKRILNPSPLSKPMAMSSDTLSSKNSFTSAVNAALQTPAKPTYAQVVNANTNSPAAQQLASLNDKGAKKSKTSRLRRALSFGSAAELRKVSAENNAANHVSVSAEPAKLRKGRNPEEQEEAEQARIAEQQEAAGIGSGIYSGQGNFFTSSTDNLSISSTASSASVMIRKMGKGMKKSTRSLVGLFRPKSVVGVPPADAPLPEVSQAQVSMVTVEAEREKINVNANPTDMVAGGTGFPHLERNSVDATNMTIAAVNDRLGSASTESGTRRSIVGGEKEPAEVLAAVKKGILKCTGTDSGNSSPVIRPVDSKPPNFNLPQVPHVNDSPNSSAPSTPNEDSQGHRRTGSVTLGGEDYFMSALRFRGESKSLPGTPAGGKRNATFSPRIQFHDTWPSGEYDRRGEIATCNRLTPMLAQQIKEELNTFKMEMEVHENSKIYTHFF